MTSEQIRAPKNAKNSLLAFTQHTFPGFQVGDHHRLIAEKLEAVARGEIDRLIIQAPPRHGKSEIASRRFPAWYLGQHPGRQIICTSYGGELAIDFGREVRDIVASEEYQEIFPDAMIRSDSRAAERWQTTKGGVYIAAGVGGAITGRGAHVALIDDPFKNREEADSEGYRNRVWHWYTNVLYTRLMPGGAVIVIMTRWHEDDLAGRLLKAQAEGGDQWEVVNLPALAKEGDALGRKPGAALWPEWYDEEALGRIRNALTILDGPRAWQALYQGDPQAEEGHFFKEEWVRWYPFGGPPKYLRIYGASDYAVTAKGGDFTVHGVIGVDPNDRIYILDWWRQQASSDVWIEAVIDLIQKWQPVAWAVEKGQIEKSVGPFLNKRMRERRVYCQFESFTSATDKATRARAISGRMSMGCVYLPKGAPWADDLVSELLKFPTGVHDDQVDVLSLFGRMLDTMYKAAAPQNPRAIAFDSPEYIRAQVAQLQKGANRPNRFEI